MGTASTMASVAEALGMTLPAQRRHSRARFRTPAPCRGGRSPHRRHGAGGPAPESDHHAARPSKTPFACSARSPDRPTASSICSPSPGAPASRWSSTTSTASAAKRPSLTNIKPSGQYQMAELFEAGGIPAVMRELLPLLHRDALTVTGKTVARTSPRFPNRFGATCVASAETPIRSRRRTLDTARQPCSGWSGHQARRRLAQLLTHRGRAVVFTSLEDLARRIHDPAARRHPGRRARAAERRPDRWTRHARSRA